MPDTRVLVVDDERSMRDLLAIMLKQEGHDVVVVEGGGQAIEALAREAFDLVITDLRMREVDGLAVLRAAKEHSPETVVVVITAFASTETAVEAMKLGAYHYVNKPFNLDEVGMLVEKALETSQLRREVRALRSSQGREYAFDAIIGIHVVPFMVEAGPIIARIAALAPGAGLPVMHSMMGTLPGKEAWFATLEAAGVPCFDDAETMAECAGLLARYPDLRAQVRTNAKGRVTLRGRGAA